MNKSTEQKNQLQAGTNVWIYVRFSPGDNQTLESQLDAVRNYCYEHGWVIDKEFIDRWTSGKSVDNRESFNLMISLSKSKYSKTKVIVFWSASRFGRNADDATYYRSMLRRNGWKLVSITEPIPEDSITARLMETFLDISSEHYIAELSTNTIRGLEYIANQGCVPVGEIPFGYGVVLIKIGVLKDGKQRNGRKPIILEEEARFVRRAFEMKSKCATNNDIAKETGVFSGKSTGSWNSFFRNKSYCGRYEFREKIYEEIFPAIIKPELFEEVQKQIPPKKDKYITRNHPRRKGGRFFLANISFCAYCGAPMEGKRVNSYRYYVCSKHNESAENCSQSGYIPSKDIETEIINLLIEQVLVADYLEELLVWTNAELNSGLEELEIRLSIANSLFEEETKTARKMARNLLLIGEGPPDSLVEVVREKEKQLSELKRNVAILKGEIQNRKILVSKSDLESFLTSGRDMIQSNESSDLLALCELLISRILMSGNEISVELHFPMT